MKKLSAAIAVLAVAGMLLTGCEAAKNNPQGTTGKTSATTTTQTTLEDIAQYTTTVTFEPDMTTLANQPDAVSEPAN
jgi:outer membrane biogenesis lipoprotein LolB